jgi:nucleoside-diphosphate-sugar epimerase
MTDLWDDLRGARVFVTGGTGFIGSWVMEAFTAACDRFRLGASAVILTRNPETFRSRRPHLANHPAVTTHRGDVTAFEPPTGRFDIVLHLAGEPNGPAYRADPVGGFERLVGGSRRVFAFAADCGARRVLLASSGAVYGRQPPGVDRLTESTPSHLDPSEVGSAYGEGKRAAELQLAAFAARHGVDAVIARGFTFVGPYLPLDGPFAVGNFLRDAAAGGPVRVNGDGTPVRSYLYGSDLAMWFWTIALRGAPGRVYNVGSDRPVSIAELAHRVAALADPPSRVVVARPPESAGAPERYVPCVNRCREELGLEVTVELSEALTRTWEWVRSGAAA